MQPTNEQLAAIDIHDKNLIVIAGAGSGKTRVLVERYLRLLERKPDWTIASLVAITFTREAASEMRHRLRLELERREREAGGVFWTQRLAQFERARIDTIHGLCADILRANAAQAGIDPLFEVMDEAEAAVMLGEVIDDLRPSIAPPLSRLFAHFDAYRIMETLNHAALVNSDWSTEDLDPEALFRGWEREWTEAAFSERDRLLASGECAALDRLAYIPEDDKLGQLALWYQARMGQARDENDAADLARLVAETYRAGAVGSKGAAGKWGGKEAKTEVAQMLRGLRERVKAARDEIGEPLGRLDRVTAELLPLWRKLLRGASGAYRERKRGAAKLDFDDLERLTDEALRDPSVRKRYQGAQFQHLLVDEFQDTNAAQWRIIQGLADLSRGGTLFVVGDPKQSIYQFRGADVSVFNRVRGEIARAHAGRALPLSMSFRSHRRLVAQLNALFAQVFAPAGETPADFEVELGQPMTAFREESPPQPAIELQLLDKSRRDENGDFIHDRRGRIQHYSAEEMRRWEAWELAEGVKSMIASAKPVYDRGAGGWRGMRYGDIAILFQSMRRAPLYEEVFKARGLPFLTIAGRGFYHRQEVWDMLDLLRCLHNPADDLSLATVLRSPFFAFSDDLLYALRLLPAESAEDKEPLPLWRALEQAARPGAEGIEAGDRPLIRHALATLTDLRELSGRVSISELLRRALTHTHYLAILTGLPDGARRRGNIEKLLQLAAESGKNTLSEFTAYLADLSGREAREGEAALEAGNAVRLMTVHASKGLEFPLVILADASWERGAGLRPIALDDPKHGLSCQAYCQETNKLESGFAHRRNLSVAARKEAAERKRLLYVAATRAQDYLLISGQVTPSRAGWKARGWMSGLLDALELGDIEREARQIMRYGGGEIAINMPHAPPEFIPSLALDQRDLWDYEARPADFPPYKPPLLAPIPASDRQDLRHVSATALAEAQSDEGDFSSARERVADDQSARGLASPAAIGLIAHELLRYHSLDDAGEISERMIRALAWEQGIHDSAALDDVVARTRPLLAAFADSDVRRWIDAARAEGRACHAETPFLYQKDSAVIRGVIDLLLRDATGDWRIVDYKSSRLHPAEAQRHAQRYRPQLGVYAAAIQARFGLPRLPRLFVHYLRHSLTIELERDDCRAALERMGPTLGHLAELEA